MYKICVEPGGSIYQVGQQNLHPVLTAAVKELQGMIIWETAKNTDGIINRLARMAARAEQVQSGLVSESYVDLFHMWVEKLTREWDKEQRVWVFGLRVWLNPVRSVCCYEGEWELTYRD